MNKAMIALFKKLEAIQEEFDGIGDTNVRDHMGEHLMHGFFKPDDDAELTGEYGLEPEANRKVEAALKAFCKAANAAAEREGLTTFRQRVTAFQNHAVKTPGGSDYNDFFGVIELKSFDEHGNVPGAKPAKPERVGSRYYTFEHSGSLDDVTAGFNAANTWKWFVNRQYRKPFSESYIAYWTWGQLCPVKPPGTGYIAKVYVEEDKADKGILEIAATFQVMLKTIGAKKIAEVTAKSWKGY